MGVPLFARGSVAGLFSLSKSEAGYFNEEHLELAEAMSSQASVAVENAILYEQMRASTVRMQTLSRRLVDVQETERREIARELHDEAGQALVSLRFGLRLMERELEQGENVRERVAELVERTDAVIENLHRLAADLRPVSLDHVGIDAALRQYVETAITSPATMVRYKARGFTAQRLPSEVETALFRIAQEAMTNVARHAAASRVDLLLEHHGDRVQMVIEDNGVGFDSRRVWDGDQIGLIGMRERAEGLGGRLTIETEVGKGTTIVVEVPSVDPHPDR
jgi:signal transduction histidine kinase